jgi:hypothetical protein
LFLFNSIPVPDRVGFHCGTGIELNENKPCPSQV